MPTIQTLLDWGYGNPDSPDYFARNIVTFRAGGIELTCHKGLIRNFAHLIRGLSDKGYDFDKGIRDDWGYANRDIRGYPGVKSWHSVGGAIDLDATKNVMGYTRTTFPVWRTKRLCREAGLTWGRTWDSRPDPMHFEVALPYKEMRRVGDRLRG